MTTAEIVADVAQTHPITVLALEPLITICAWCLGAREATLELKARGVAAISHGLCETCSARVFERSAA